MLRLRPVTVYRLCQRGTLPHLRVSNAIRVRPEDLDAYLRSPGSIPLRTSFRRGR
jgi:excisionase family DNA binding protein